ncbi:hypothetical protein Bbelb_192530 [Branchiostoma belcheri]|nr:hypothetical protein Bbelb_192530 [Branchiostoma belcheri]
MAMRDGAEPRAPIGHPPRCSVVSGALVSQGSVAQGESITQGNPRTYTNGRPKCSPRDLVTTPTRADLIPTSVPKGPSMPYKQPPMNGSGEDVIARQNFPPNSLTSSSPATINPFLSASPRYSFHYGSIPRLWVHKHYGEWPVSSEREMTGRASRPGRADFWSSDVYHDLSVPDSSRLPPVLAR